MFKRLDTSVDSHLNTLVRVTHISVKFSRFILKKCILWVYLILVQPKMKVNLIIELNFNTMYILNILREVSYDFCCIFFRINPTVRWLSVIMYRNWIIWKTLRKSLVSPPLTSCPRNNPIFNGRSDSHVTAHLIGPLFPLRWCFIFEFDPIIFDKIGFFLWMSTHKYQMLNELLSLLRRTLLLSPIIASTIVSMKF